MFLNVFLYKFRYLIIQNKKISLNHYNDLIRNSFKNYQRFVGFADITYCNFYYNKNIDGWGIVVILDNKGVFDIYRLNSNFSTNSDTVIEPTISYGTIKSTMYQHYKKSAYDYDIQILLPTNNYCHGIMLFGGSISKFVNWKMI